MASHRSFIGVFTHELRNLLAPMRNGVQMLRFRGADDPALKAATDIIDRQIENIVKLIETAADADHVQRGEATLAVQPLDLNGIIKDVLAMQQPLIGQRSIQLNVTLPQAPVMLEADPARLQQALGNLIEHAALSAKENGALAIEAAATPHDVCIRIRNQVSIEPEVLASLFDFDAAARVRVRAAAGLDVGLAVARSLVELHRGRVTVTSDASGSEFAVYLPLAAVSSPENERSTIFQPVPEAGQSARDSGIQSGPGAGPRRRILIADDSAAVRTSLAGVLTEMGHDVETASNGAEAVEMAQRSRPDFVLLDVYMPGLNGVNAARQLRAQFPPSAMRLVMMSGNTLDSTTVRAAQEAGFDHCVDKVFDFDALRELLAS